MSTRAELYPEHEKLRAIDAGEKRGVTDFLEWLDGRDYVICRREGVRSTDYSPVGLRIEGWLADFFEIDQEKLMNEKEQMIEAFRKESARPVESDKVRRRDR